MRFAILASDVELRSQPLPVTRLDSWSRLPQCNHDIETGDCTVISLKKYLDADALHPYQSEPDPGELLPAVLKAYRSALLAMGQSGFRAYPAVGSDLQQHLISLVSLLSRDLTPSLVQETEEQVEEQLRRWGSHTEEYFKAKANDIKE